MKGRMEEFMLAKLMPGRTCEEREMGPEEISVSVVGLIDPKVFLLEVLIGFFLMLPVPPLV